MLLSGKHPDLSASCHSLAFSERTGALIQGIIMNKKLTCILLAFGLLFGPTAGHAQQKDAASSDSKKGLDRMSKELGLSAEQRSKVGAIFEIERNKVEAIFNEERQKLQVVQQDTRASLEGVLTAKQMNKLDQKMRENAKNEAKKK